MEGYVELTDIATSSIRLCSGVSFDELEEVGFGVERPEVAESLATGGCGAANTTEDIEQVIRS